MVSLQLKANGFINKSKGHFGTHLHSAFQHMSTMQHAKKTLYIKYHTVILTYCIRRISDKWNNTLLPFHKMRSKRQYTHSCFTLALLASQSQDKKVALRNLQPTNEVAFEKIQAKVAKTKKTSRNRMKFMKLARPDIYQIYHVYQIYQIYQIALNVRTSLKQNSQPLLLLLVLKPLEVGIQPRQNSVSTSTTGYIHLCLLRRSCRRRHRACLAREL